MSFTFRELTTSDYNQYKLIINEFRPTEFTEEEFIDILSNIKKTSEIWIIIDEKGSFIAIGTIIFEYKFIFNTCIYAHIEDVCVSEKYRDQGFGKKMILKLFERAKEKECYKVTLDCADHNIIFYEKCGLEKRGNQMCQLISNLK